MAKCNQLTSLPFKRLKPLLHKYIVSSLEMPGYYNKFISDISAGLYCIRRITRCRGNVRWRSGFLEEEQVRGGALGRVLGGRCLFDVLATMDGAVGGARVDACEVDVGVDGAEDQAEEAEHQDGDHAARDQRLAYPVPSAGARCRRRRRTDFGSYRHVTPSTKPTSATYTT